MLSPDEIAPWLGALIAGALWIAYWFAPRAAFDERVCAEVWEDGGDWHTCHRPDEHTGPHACGHCEAMAR